MPFQNIVHLHYHIIDVSLLQVMQLDSSMSPQWRILFSPQSIFNRAHLLPVIFIVVDDRRENVITIKRDLC